MARGVFCFRVGNEVQFCSPGQRDVGPEKLKLYLAVDEFIRTG